MILARLAARSVTARNSGMRWSASKRFFSEAPKPAKKMNKVVSADQRVRFQRSSAERQPKLVVGILAFGIASGAISCISFYEFSRCDEGEMDADSFLYSTETVTGTKFPLTLMNYSEPGSTHWIAAKTVRCMLGLCSLERARAYSYALYISTEGAKACEKCSSIEDINKTLLPVRMCEIEAENVAEEYLREKESPSFFPAQKFQGKKEGYFFTTGVQGLGYYKDEFALVSKARMSQSSYPAMILRMVMLRDVEGTHLAHGFDRTLLDRVRFAQGNRKEGTGKSSLRTLNQFLERYGEFKRGAVIEFVRLPEGDVRVRVDGHEMLKIHSEALSWAVFDAYMGPKGHMSKESKAEFLERTREINSILETEE